MVKGEVRSILKTEVQKSNYNILLFFVGLLIGMIFGGVYYSISAEDYPYTYYISPNLNDTLHQINKNCGSTFFTHQFNKGEEYFVFKSNVCDGKKCENKYLTIEECLNG